MIKIASNSQSMLTLVFTITLISCQPEKVDLSEYLKGWEFYTTFKILPSHSITFEKVHPEIVSGEDDVLVVEIEKKPIFKGDDKISDLRSYRFLLIQLSLQDTLVTPAHLGESKIFRQVVAMSPHNVAELLMPEEEIKIKRISVNRWSIDSNLDDFKFSGIFSFADSLLIKNHHIQFMEQE